MKVLLDAVRRLYGALLLLLPADIRRAHGTEMQHTSRHIVEDTLRARGPLAAVAAAVGECADVVAAAFRASRRAPSELRQDVALAWRVMRARPAFAAVLVCTLAIGIGATTAVFTVVNALLLRPLPYSHPDRLVLLTALSQRSVQLSLSPRDFHDMTSAMPSLESSAAFTDEQVNLTGTAEPERVASAVVTWNFFDVIGAPMHVGRGFTRAEGEAGSELVIVISHALWQRRFGGRGDILGRETFVNGRPHTVVGIASPSMTLPGRPSIWRPLVFTPHQLDASQRGARWISVIARMKPGVEIGAAESQAHTVAARLAADFPRTHRGRGASVRPLHTHLVATTRPGLIALFGAVALVLLIACANVANLLLARSTARSTEMTIRMALGATSGRLLRQSLAENLLLTTVASAAGLVLAAWATRAATAVLPQALPRAEEIAVDWRVAAFATGTAMALAAALAVVASVGVRERAVQASSRVVGAGTRRARRALIVAEVAMALVLLTAAGLFLKSLANLYGTSPGFEPERVLTFSITMPEASYPQPEQARDLVARLRADLALQPGVEAAAGIFGLPLTHGFGASSSFERIGRPSDPDNEPMAAMRIVTPEYFNVMRIALRGRDFNERDTLQSPGVAIVNETAARKYWPGEDPIGQSLRLHVGLTSVRQTPRQVVGVVRDVRFGGLDVEPGAEVYIPHAQHPIDGLMMTLRTSDGPRLAIPAARATLQQIDPNMPMADVATMEEIVAESVAARRFSLALLAVFAATALLLAAIGIYGVLSFTVGQRTRENGVRLAMGAPRSHVLRLVVGEGLLLVGAGLALGFGATLAITGAIRGLLFEVQPSDPPTLLLVGAVLLLVALAASYLPARRAAAVDPVMALRTE